MSTSIFKMLNTSQNAYILYDINSKHIITQNKAAITYFADKNNEINLSNNIKTFEEIVLNAKKNLETSTPFLVNSLNIICENEQELLVNIEIDYFDELKTQMYIIIKPFVRENLDVDQMFFEAIQSLSSDIFFEIYIKERALVHLGEMAEKFSLPPRIENFPESVIENNNIHPDYLNDYMIYARNMLNGIGGKHEVRIKMATDAYEWFRIHSTIIKDSEGRAIKVVGKLQNIEENKSLEVKASQDLLTKLLNKISFMKCVELELLEENDVQYALIFIDIDDFKTVNDSLGHDFGDKLLENVGNILRSSIREYDYAGRVGGDEFVLFIKDIPSLNIIQEKADHILFELQKVFKYEDKEHNTKASIGISVAPMHGSTYDELYKKSDLALYESKRKGKNVATIYMKDENKY